MKGKSAKNVREFQPSQLAIFYHSLFFIRRRLFQAIREKSPHLTGLLIDFGCGSKPYRNLITVNQYVGVDIRVSGHNHADSDIDVYYDGRTLPFDDAHFDSFLSSEVFEHLPNPHRMARELYRVLKPNGMGLVTVPFVWPMHEVPYDFNRFTFFGIQELFKDAGFEIVEAHKLGTYGEVMVQLLSYSFYVKFGNLPRLIRLFAVGLTVLPLNVFGLAVTRFWARNQDLYFNTLLVLKKKSAS
jgi:SAM-dependent methyltransferase